MTALLGTLAATAICFVSIRAALRALGLDLMETLLWLGVAEVPAPPCARRRIQLVTVTTEAAA